MVTEPIRWEEHVHSVKALRPVISRQRWVDSRLKNARDFGTWMYKWCDCADHRVLSSMLFDYCVLLCSNSMGGGAYTIVSRAKLVDSGGYVKW
jgi:hypothetical protein